MQVRCFLLACPSPLPLGAAVFSTPVSCMQLSALLFFILGLKVGSYKNMLARPCPWHYWWKMLNTQLNNYSSNIRVDLAFAVISNIVDFIDFMNYAILMN